MPTELILFLSLLSRCTGFFLLSPLFVRYIPVWIRFGLTLVCPLLLLPPLLAQSTLTIQQPLILVGKLLQEAALGYLLGFIFTLLFEAAAFAGQFVGTLTGFSATELLDPLSNTSHPLIAKLFTLILFALFLAFDLHHSLLRLLYEGYMHISPHLALGVIDATSRVFSQAISYAYFPISLLLLVIASFAIISRFFPNLQIFWTGFPIQLLIGIISITYALGFFGPMLHNAFHEFWVLTKKILFSL